MNAARIPVVVCRPIRICAASVRCLCRDSDPCLWHVDILLSLHSEKDDRAPQIRLPKILFAWLLESITDAFWGISTLSTYNHSNELAFCFEVFLRLPLSGNKNKEGNWKSQRALNSPDLGPWLLFAQTCLAPKQPPPIIITSAAVFEKQSLPRVTFLVTDKGIGWTVYATLWGRIGRLCSLLFMSA